MKKITAIILMTAILTLSLFGCQAQNDEETTTTEPESTSETAYEENTGDTMPESSSEETTQQESQEQSTATPNPKPQQQSQPKPTQPTTQQQTQPQTQSQQTTQPQRYILTTDYRGYNSSVAGREIWQGGHFTVLAFDYVFSDAVDYNCVVDHYPAKGDDITNIKEMILYVNEMPKINVLVPGIISITKKEGEYREDYKNNFLCLYVKNISGRTLDGYSEVHYKLYDKDGVTLEEDSFFLKDMASQETQKVEFYIPHGVVKMDIYKIS